LKISSAKQKTVGANSYIYYTGFFILLNPRTYSAFEQKDTAKNGLSVFSPLLFDLYGLASTNSGGPFAVLWLAFLRLPAPLHPYILGFAKNFIQDNAVLGLLQGQNSEEKLWIKCE